MGKHQYGCSKVEVGVMNPSTGTITWNATPIEVYQDSITLDQPEPQKTEHFQQGNPRPKVVRNSKTSKTINFSIMDLSADSKVAWLGGTKSTVDGVDTWNEPEIAVASIKKAIRFTLEDGSVITTPNLDCAARLSGNLNETDIMLIPVVGTVTDTGAEGVSSFSWSDATPEG